MFGDSTKQIEGLLARLHESDATLREQYARIEQLTEERGRLAEAYMQLAKTHNALLDMHQGVLAQFASMKREGFVADERPLKPEPEAAPLPGPVQDAIEQRSFDVPTRQTLIQYAREHLQTESADDVAEIILNGGPIPVL